MNIVELVRLEESEQGTFGVLKVNKRVVCLTLEPKDMENQQDISSIPAQQYICKKVDSPGFGRVFKVTNVPGRSNVLFHIGNTDKNTAGCILLGSTYGDLNGKRAVLGSGTAFKRFYKKLAGAEKFHLTIQEHF